MPFDIVTRERYHFARLLGVVTAEDLRQFALDVAAVEDATPAAMDRACDITPVERWDIDFDAMAELAAHRRARTFKAPVKSALIARHPVELGFARMFQTLNDHPQIEIRIVWSLEEAEEWFGGL